jgi:hypothetical protein
MVAGSQADLEAGRLLLDLELHVLANGEDGLVVGQDLAEIKQVTVPPGGTLERVVETAIPVERVGSGPLSGVMRHGTYTARVIVVVTLAESAEKNKWVPLTSAPFSVELPRQPKLRDCKTAMTH